MDGVKQQFSIGSGKLQKLLFWLGIQQLSLSPPSSGQNGITAWDLSSDEPFFLLLQRGVGAVKVKVFGRLAATKNTLEVESIDITTDLSNGKDNAKLEFSTLAEAMKSQFAVSAQNTSGLNILEKRVAIVAALLHTDFEGKLNVADLFHLYQCIAPAWIMQLLSQIALKPKSDAKCNAVWIFAIPFSIVMKLELHLQSEDFQKKLKTLLPDNTDDFWLIVRRTTCPALLSQKVSKKSELVFCTKLQVGGPNKIIQIFITTQHNSLTVSVVKSGDNISITELLQAFFGHFRNSFSTSDLDKIWNKFALLIKQLGVDIPQADEKLETGTTVTNTPVISWHDFAFTVTWEDSHRPSLRALNMTFEADTKIGAEGTEYSRFLFKLSWSILEGIDLSGSFQPGDTQRDTQRDATLEQQLNPFMNVVMQISPSKAAGNTVKLMHLHPALSVDDSSFPSWIPQQINALDITVSKEHVIFHTRFTTSPSTIQSPSGDVSAAFSDGAHYELLVDYGLDVKKSLNQFSFHVSIPLSASGISEELPPCTMHATIEKVDGLWQITGKIDALYLACLASVFPQEHREPLVNMMGHAMLFDVELDYSPQKGGGGSLKFSGSLFLAGLELDLSYSHTSGSQLILTAVLRDLAPDETPSDISLASLLAAFTGHEQARDLPDILKAIRFSTKGLSLLFKCTTPAKEPKRLIWGITMTIGSVSITLAQLSSPNLPKANTTSTVTSKRLLRVRLLGFSACYKIPVAGDVNLPFDRLDLYWLNFNLTATEKDDLNTAVFATDLITLKDDKAADDEVVMKQGLHFLATHSSGGRPSIFMDHLASPVANLRNDTAPTNLAQSSTAPEPTSQPQTTAYRKSQGGLQIFDCSIQMKGKSLNVSFTATAHLGPLEVAMNGLTLQLDFSNAMLPDIQTIPLTFALRGLGIGYDQSGIKIAGELMHGSRTSTAAAGGTEDYYSGGVMIETSKYSFGAVGAYDKVTPGNGADFSSLFVFGALTGFIMRFGYIEVTGVMGGFGYNSHLTQPDPTTVYQFPFFQLADQVSDPLMTLSSLEKGSTITPKANSLWFAAGLVMKAFHVVDIKAVVTVDLSSDEPMLGLVGMATATVPPDAKSDGKPFALIALGVVATLDPNHGSLEIQGQFLPFSYILSEDCHPTGGFALCYWFHGSPHEGDFVFSVGGYHPAFSKPEHYPTVPRVGIRWNYDDNLTISGEAYFAVTASACMAGGKLSAVYQLSWLYAHLDAWADFLVVYEPFQYNIGIGVTAGVRAFVDTFICTISISIELGAELRLQGPPMAGTAHFTFWLFSFDVSFGTTGGPRDPLSLDEFLSLLKQKHSDSPDVTGNDHNLSFANCLLPNPASSKDSTELREEALVRGSAFNLIVQSRMAVTQIIAGMNKEVHHDNTIYSKPMHLNQDTKGLTSTMDIEVNFFIDEKNKKDLTNEKMFTTSAYMEQSPIALWGEYKGDNDMYQDIDGTRGQTTQMLMGVTLGAPPPEISHDNLPSFTKDNFEKIEKLEGNIGIIPQSDPTVKRFVLTRLLPPASQTPAQPKGANTTSTTRTSNNANSANASNTANTPNTSNTPNTANTPNTSNTPNTANTSANTAPSSQTQINTGSATTVTPAKTNPLPSLAARYEVLFQDTKAHWSNSNPEIQSAVILEEFCMLASSTLPDNDVEDTHISSKYDMPTDHFSYREMAQHASRPLVYIGEMEDWYVVPPRFYDQFIVPPAPVAGEK